MYYFFQIFFICLIAVVVSACFCYHESLKPVTAHEEGTLEPLLRDHPDERPAPLERPYDDVNLNMNVLISTPDKWPLC